MVWRLGMNYVNKLVFYSFGISLWRACDKFLVCKEPKVITKWYFTYFTLCIMALVSPRYRAFNVLFVLDKNASVGHILNTMGTLQGFDQSNKVILAHDVSRWGPSGSFLPKKRVIRTSYVIKNSIKVWRVWLEFIFLHQDEQVPMLCYWGALQKVCRSENCIFWLPSLISQFFIICFDSFDLLTSFFYFFIRHLGLDGIINVSYEKESTFFKFCSHVVFIPNIPNICTIGSMFFYLLRISFLA